MKSPREQQRTGDATMEMTRKQFESICSLVRDQSGIKLASGKEELVKARVAKRLRSLSMTSLSDYLAYLRNGGGSEELSNLLDAISTNVTSFFREPDHFSYLRNTVLPNIVSGAGRRGKLRIWSAGCSSGEEPYSIGIHLSEGIQNLDAWDARILATDLSLDMLGKARQAIYDEQRIEGVPAPLRSRYFERLRDGKQQGFRVCGRVRGLVHIARLNLMGSWPMQGPFDAIFCRNVMIYFDKPTQSKLIGRFRNLLAPGGTLFLGHSESLTGNRDDFRHVRSTIYQRV
jgi:chemotaxis protein methyltransferase CheR